MNSLTKFVVIALFFLSLGQTVMPAEIKFKQAINLSNDQKKEIASYKHNANTFAWFDIYFVNNNQAIKIKTKLYCIKSMGTNMINTIKKGYEINRIKDVDNDSVDDFSVKVFTTGARKIYYYIISGKNKILFSCDWDNTAESMDFCTYQYDAINKQIINEQARNSEESKKVYKYIFSKEQQKFILKN